MGSVLAKVKGRQWNRRGIVWVLAWVLVLGLGAHAWGQLDAVLNTRTGSTFASIQEAVDAPDTLDGDVIQVDSLTYDSGYEPGATPDHLLYIEKTVMIYSTLGPADTIVDAFGWPCAVELAAEGCTLDGLAFIGSTERGIVCAASGAVLNELIVRPSDGDGVVLLEGTTNSSVLGCLIDNMHHAPCVPDIEWIGIRLESSSDNALQGNVLQGVCFAIALFGDSDGNLIEGNTVAGAEFAAIRLGSSYPPHGSGDPWHNEIVGNNLLDNTWGIILRGNVDHTTVCGNTIEGCVKDGISLSPSNEDPGDPVDKPDGNLICENTVMACEHAIVLMNAHTNTVEWNEVFESHIGIALHDGASGNAVLDNIANLHTSVGIHVVESHGNTLLRNTADDNYWGGIELFMSDDTVVQECIVRGTTHPEGTGIGISTGMDNTLVWNRVEDCFAGFSVHPEFGPAAGNTISQNHVERVEFGIFLAGAGNTLTENTFLEFYRTGIQPMGSDHVVADNVLVGAPEARTGIFLIGSLEAPDEEGARILIERNEITGGLRGIILYMGRENTVRENTVWGHAGPGMLISLANRNLIEGNAITQNGCGITIPWFDSLDNIFHGNTLTNNAHGAVLTSAPSTFYTDSQLAAPLFDNLGNEYLGNTPDPLTSCMVPLDVPLDVKPCSCPNPLNTKDKGVLPVAVLGSPELDVRQIDSATLTLGGVPLLRDAYEDVAAPYEPYTGKTGAEDCSTAGPDGFEDLVLKFNPQEIVAALGAVADRDVVVLALEGFLFDGTPIFGEDVILILDEESKTLSTREGGPLRIMAAPNPVSQTGLELWIEGLEPVRIRVEIYDLAGKLIFDSGVQAGPTFVWSLSTDEGEDVANGVYVCRISALNDDGAIITTEIRTVAVLR